ncbi:hypothetical protein N9J36_08080 [Litoricola sp.]|jgi:Trk K+ transport system NAD-binding subunit|nr:hypothetical protein [Litorivicinus sp.]MDA9007554.1 hypothetical protein [Litorivicinus sp.]
MIHLVTSENALDDALEWIRADDQVVLAGKALQAVHRIPPISSSVAIFEDDAAFVPSGNYTTLSMDQWLDLLEASPCRTWS